MRIIVAGDFCDRERVSEKIKLGLQDDLFGKIKQTIGDSDFSIVNFEFPVSDGTTPIMKCGTAFNGQDKAVGAIKSAGFNVCTMANNHILDQGGEACIKTKTAIEEAGMHSVGAGKDRNSAAGILYLKKDDETLAIINCCEHEFSIAGDSTPGANPVNPISQYYEISEAKRNADYVLVIVHGGHEHFQLPSMRMKETYRFFIDAGADAVVNHHQHCYSGYEFYRGKPIVYGTGNFLFDSATDIKYRKSTFNFGYLANIEFTASGEKLEILPFEQCLDSPGVFPLEGEKLLQFNQRIEELNRIIRDDYELVIRLNEYYTREADTILDSLQPYHGRIMKKLAAMKVLPRILGRDHYMRLLNLVECESHKDKLTFSLRSTFNDR